MEAQENGHAKEYWVMQSYAGNMEMRLRHSHLQILGFRVPKPQTLGLGDQESLKRSGFLDAGRHRHEFPVPSNISLLGLGAEAQMKQLKVSDAK